MARIFARDFAGLCLLEITGDGHEVDIIAGFIAGEQGALNLVTLAVADVHSGTPEEAAQIIAAIRACLIDG